MSEQEDEGPKYDNYDENYQLIQDEPTNSSFLCGNCNMHCKELDLVRIKSNYFVLISVQEEKRLGLEKVKEFCVSGSEFDKMIQFFETPKHENFPKQKDFMFDKMCDFNFALSHNLFRKTFGKELFQNNNDFVINECFSKLEHFICLRQLCELIKTKECYESRINISYLKYLFSLDPADIIRLSLSVELNAGYKIAWKRKRRTNRREEDKRFKPPDLYPNLRQDVTLFVLIKQEPPDATPKSTPSLNRLGGNSFVLYNSKFSDLSLVHVVHADSRTNPFQEGESDVILGRPKTNMDDPGLGADGLGDYEHEMDDLELGIDDPTSTMDVLKALKFNKWLSGPMCALFPCLWVCPIGFTKDRFLMRPLARFPLSPFIEFQAQPTPPLQSRK